MELNETEVKPEEQEVEEGNFFKKKLELKRRREKEERLRIIREYSSVIESMPEELKQMLTSRMGNIIVTPQESFLSHFYEAIPKYAPEVFRLKFVETFQFVHERAIKQLTKGKKKNANCGNELFWKEFEILFDGMNGSKKSKEGIFTRIKIFFFNIWTIAKMFRRAIFGALMG